MYGYFPAAHGSGSFLNKANKEILTAHLKGCVVAATTDAEKEEKVDELVAMLGKILK